MAHLIECEQIPKIQLDILSRTLLAAMERFYSDPDNQRRYEECGLGRTQGNVFPNLNNEHHVTKEAILCTKSKLR